MFDPFATSSTEGSACAATSWSPLPLGAAKGSSSFDDNTSSSSSRKLVNCLGNPEVTPEIPTPKTPPVPKCLPTPVLEDQQQQQEEALMQQQQQQQQQQQNSTLCKAAKKARKKALKKANKKALKKEAKKAKKAGMSPEGAKKKKKKDKKQPRDETTPHETASPWAGSDEEDDDDDEDDEDSSDEELQQEILRENDKARQQPQQQQQHTSPEPNRLTSRDDRKLPPTPRRRTVLELPPTPQRQEGMPEVKETPPPPRPGQILHIKRKPRTPPTLIAGVSSIANKSSDGPSDAAGASVGAPPPERRHKSWRQDREESVQSSSWVSGDLLTNDDIDFGGAAGGGGASHASPGTGYHRPSMIEVTKSMGRVMNLNSTRSAGTMSTLGNGTVGAGTTTSSVTTKPAGGGGGRGGGGGGGNFDATEKWALWVAMQSSKDGNSTTTSREDELLRAYREEQDEPLPQPTYLGQQQKEEDDQPHPDLIVQYLMSMGITEEAAKQTAVQYHASNIGRGAARWTSSSSQSKQPTPPTVIGNFSFSPTVAAIRAPNASATTATASPLAASPPIATQKLAHETQVQSRRRSSGSGGAGRVSNIATKRPVQRRTLAAATTTPTNDDGDDDVSLGDYDEELAAPPQVGSASGELNMHDSMSSTISESRRGGVPAPTTWPRATSAEPRDQASIRRPSSTPSAASLFVTSSSLAFDVPEPAEHDGELVEAKAIHLKEKKKPLEIDDGIVFAESTPLSLKHLWEERGIRRFVWLTILVIVVIVVVVVAVVVTSGNRRQGQSDAPLAAPTMAPSLAPTVIKAELEVAALAVSNQTVFEEGSPQRRAVGWMSTFDRVDTDGYGEVWAQRYIMTVFYFATGGPQWNDVENWLHPNMHECDWGVETIFCAADVTGQRHVVGIYQTRNIMRGTIPNELSRLDLQVLRLSRNELTGTIPRDGCERWTRLYALDLSQNAFSGRIPENVGSCTGLLEIRLSSNGLTGTLPTSLHDLFILQELDLENNQFTGPITSENVGGLRALNKVNLRRNQFTGTLPPIELLPKLDVIWLDHNRFNGTLPLIPAALAERQELTLSHNRLTGSIGFNYSSIVDDIDYKISNIDFGFNEFTGTFPMFLSWLPSLRRLSVSGNNLEGRIYDEVFDFGPMDGWIYLEHLEMAYNKLTGDIPITRSRPALSYLDLRGNKFQGGFNEKFQYLPRIEFLLLSDNPDLQDSLNASLLENQTSLRDLELRNTALSGSIPNAVGLLTKLNILDLGDNNLMGTIPTSFGELTLMNTLRIDNNGLTGTIPTQVTQMTLLQQLDIQSNGLTGSFPFEINSLPNLRSLNVSGNELEGRITTGLCNRATVVAEDVGCNLVCACCPNLETECDENVFSP